MADVEPDTQKSGAISRIIERAGMFAVSTSAHGLARLTFGSRLQRGLWIFFLLVAFGGFSAHLFKVVNSYYGRPVNVKSFLSEENIQFPTLTLCADTFNAPVAFTWTQFVPFSKYNLHKVFTNADKVWKRLLKPSEMEWVKPLSRASVKPFIYNTDLYLQPHEVVIKCLYRGEICDFRNFTIYRDPVYGPCVQFNPDSNKRRLHTAGPQGGLFLIIHSPNRFLWLNSWEFLTYAEGYLMALSAEKQQPDFHSTFFSPQLDRWLIVEINQIYRSSIDRPWISKCKSQKSGVNYTVKSNLQSWNYSVKNDKHACDVLEQQKNLTETCGCFSPFLPLPADLARFPSCFTLPYFFLFGGKLNKTQLSLEYKLAKRRVQCARDIDNLRPRSSPTQSKRCTPSCEMWLYQSDTIVPMWPHIRYQGSNLLPNVEKNLKLAEAMGLRTLILRDLQNQLQKVEGGQIIRLHPIEIYASELKIEFHKEELTFELPQLLSSIGGMMGLWIGYSVITLFEMMEFILWIVHTCFTISRYKDEQQT